jgi:hypothetical protein
VVEGPISFSLCKGHGKYKDRNFGYYCWALNPRQKLRDETEMLKSLMPWLFELFEHGVPVNWLAKSGGYVDPHAFMTRQPRSDSDGAR